MSYRAPVKDMAFMLNDVAGLQSLVSSGLYEEATPDLIEAVLEEAGKLAENVIAPLNDGVDANPAKLKDKEVTTSPGFADAYRQWVEGGWGAIAGSGDYGGQGLPMALAAALQEIWNGASLSFGLCPILSQGAVEALSAHGTDEQREKYLTKLISGEWTGTMNLTEPQAGSDLNALKTKAVPQEDGSYLITGTKIYITYGEHDMAENIIHLVLARLPDAPAGTKGISLFLVPKYLVNEDGSLGERNDVECIGLEEKLGIHGSPTCVMAYGEKGGAKGYLIGQENRGLNCMFTMMNNARLLVGIQGVAVAERAYQHALAYAKDRKQGRKVGSQLAPGEMDPIIDHADVRRMLMSMKSLAAAARGICYANAVAIDRSHKGKSEEEKAAGKARADLLTPIAKAWSTDAGVEAASIGVQVHGGMGFIEETGAARFYRDARILPIYEGTNGIQAIDLVTRKLPLGNGEVVKAYLDEIAESVEKARASNDPDLGIVADRLEEGLSGLEEATDWMLARLKDAPNDCLAGASPYLKLFGTVAGGHYLTRAALLASGEEGPKVLARFFAENFAGPAKGLVSAAIAGESALMDRADSLLEA
ncbi:acyl-CoA dehydrogenase domain-containing protein [Tepidicaulis marinus]|uniref:3-methylmercaptopropionyl-CoA dehydrogenase n=1 Tax=Tepidicaulis marinus TaxID=1333998 RepID=A0A081BDK0_9HYPH|nr:acyl-CoA dehydrogenase [Tepidicaulis marinus]GAK46118.1 acyl-CoA dehydrogenase domain-containing protein [Tepidicaulis marinus]